jgi:Major Facilitator Superfamily
LAQRLNGDFRLDHRPRIPRTVWALGIVSLFMDLSSEIIHALLPLFLTTTLGVSVAMVGLIDGIAEATASISKVFSGYISDRIGRRKPLILLGYGLGALSKPLFALAGSAPMVLGARFADRIGKGLRGAPRDALVADVTPVAIRGRAFGLRQSLDTVGAFAGPLLAIGLMAAFANDMRLVFWVAVVPAILAVLCVIFGVEERTDHATPKPERPPIACVLGRCRAWSYLYAGAVQRSIPDLQGIVRGAAADLCTRRARRHECGLCARCLSCGHCIRSRVGTHSAGLGTGLPDPRRSCPGASFRTGRGVRRDCPLGSAHGAHAGVDGKAGGGSRAARTARFSIRNVQPCGRSGRLGASSTFLAGAGFATVALIALALNRFRSATVST